MTVEVGGANIGFVGLGNMGAPMAERLIEAGNRLIVFDIDKAQVDTIVSKGAIPAPSIAAMGAEAQIVFVSLPTPDIVQAVCAELATEGQVRLIVDLSTTGPKMSRSIGQMLSSRGIAFIDCPVSGGVAGARKGSLALMAGGDADHIAEVRAQLDQFGRVFHVGPEPGMGQLMKVINNLMSAAALAVSGEGVTMAVKGGLDPATVVDVLNAGSGRNSATLDKFPRQILPGTFDAGFAIGLMLKDVRLCLEQADAFGLDVPTARTVGEVWEKAASVLGADADFTRVVELAESSAGVQVRAL